MDYLEGALLGKLWSDTDFENRKHRGMGILLCALFWIYGIYLMFLINFTDGAGPLPYFPVWIILTAVLLIASPFICYYYYDVALLFRLVFLALQVLKYYFSIQFLYSLVMPFFKFDREKLITDILAFFNNNVGKFFDTAGANISMGSMFFKTVMLALISMLVLIAVFAVLALIPFLYIKLIKLIQLTIDKSFIRFMKQVKSGRRKSSEIPGMRPR